MPYLYTQWFANKKAGHEEQDVIIPRQVQKAMDNDYRNVKIIAHDTDVFILPLDYYQKMN